MSETVSTPPSRASVHLRVSWWWSRHDDLANRQLADIFARHGHPCSDISSPDAVDASLRTAVQSEAALDELAEWVEMITVRRGGSNHQNPQRSLGRFTDYLVRKLSEKPLTAIALRECRQQIGFTDETLREGRDLPELAHADEEMTALLRRYNEVRATVLAATPTEV